MTRKQVDEWCKANDIELTLFDNLDEALVGIGSRFELDGHRTFVIYDRQKCIDIFVKDGMTEEEAEEWMGFNVEGAYIGQSTPAFMFVPEAT